MNSFMKEMKDLKKKYTSSIELGDIGVPRHVRQGYAVLGNPDGESDDGNNHSLMSENSSHQRRHTDPKEIWRNQLQSQTRPSPHCCTTCCGTLSLFGFIFLFIMGLLIRKRDTNKFIHGLHPENKEDLPSSLAASVFISALMYGGTFVLCAFFYIRAKRAALIWDNTTKIQEHHLDWNEDEKNDELRSSM